MSADKRLGANPLEWVVRDPADGAGNAPLPDQQAAEAATPPISRESPAPTAESAIFLSDTVSEEDLMSNGKVKIKQNLETTQAAAHLEDLAKSLASGVIRAQNGEESIVLFAADTVKFEMKLSRKKDKAKCSIELEWTDDGSKAEGFSISG
ncbi:amphi-Trp domain-containing protein [Pseudodesulfovibrio sp.]|uniref:amphi-Trp domain-containing protein n=1 Tax=unclassified Pseudodesulfovibrio TaxID=2661612 RepID=UPI003AFFDE22